MSKTGLALNNLRAVIILIVFATHSCLAYLGSATASAFNKAPYLWRAFPIVDAHRWYGIDPFFAWPDIALMALLFFLSALFTWPSIARKGTGKFLAGRFVRLGIPYLFGVLVLMPLSLYAAYLTTAADPSIPAYVHHLFALPFWDNGPMWFLWQLLALTIIAAALHRFAPRAIEYLGTLSAKAIAHPVPYFLGLTVAAIIAYVPMALAFTPWAWADRGPVSIQFCRPLLYLVFYVAGLSAGVQGFDKGLLASDGALVRQWTRWLGANAISLAVWLGLMGLSLMTKTAPLALQLALDFAFAITASTGCFAALAVTLRFAGRTSRALDGLSNHALGYYVIHYPFTVWLQYALLGVALFAVVKAVIVFALSLVLSMAALSVLRRVPFAALLVGETPEPLRFRLSAPYPRRVRETPASTPLAPHLP